MATTLYGRTDIRGAYVYVHRKPVRCGYISDYTTMEYTTNGRKYSRIVATVHWMDGSVTAEDPCYLSNFEALIEDHRKKLQTHSTNLAKLEELKRKNGHP